MVQPLQPRSYASILATGIKPPVKPKACPGLHFELTLAQVNHARPALADLSNDDLADSVAAAKASSWLEALVKQVLSRVKEAA